MGYVLGYRQVNIEGHAFWVHPVTGRVFPEVRGGDGPDDPPEPKSFTQEDVDRMVGQARVEARRAAERELVDQLGITPAEAKAKLDELAKLDEARKDEATKAREAAERAEAARVAAEAERDQARAEALATAALTAAGVQAANLTHALRLVDIVAGDDAEAAKAKAEALKASVPAFFTPAPAVPPRPGATPPAPATPPGTPPAPGAIDPAREAARQRLGLQPANA